MTANSSIDLRILLLEDSDIDAELILRELTQRGTIFVYCRAKNRSEFSQGILDFQPDVILADYRLPAFNGGEALALALKCCPEVPVIIVSGAVGEEVAIELMKDGATDFVLKDRLSTRLLPALHRAVREVGERQARQQAEAALRNLNAQLEQRVAERTNELSAKNALLNEDLEMARELQMTFIPEHFPTLPRGVSQATSAVKFSSISHPTGSVSSDYYNMVSVSDTAVGIFICDVAGHGVRAALVTAMLRTLQEQLSALADDPGALLTQMNQSLRRILGQLDTSLFASACYLVVDIAKGRLSFANAGHPSPLIVRDATSQVEALDAQEPAGLALGLLDDAHYLTHELTVDVGDLLLLFTDGLFQAKNTKAEMFGIARLCESLSNHAGLPLAKLIQDVFSEVERFVDGQAFCDDICLVGMEVNYLETSLSKQTARVKTISPSTKLAMA